jgi:hypothetical protein
MVSLTSCLEHDTSEGSRSVCDSWTCSEPFEAALYGCAEEAEQVHDGFLVAGGGRLEAAPFLV